MIQEKFFSSVIIKKIKISFEENIEKENRIFKKNRKKIKKYFKKIFLFKNNF